MIINTFAPTEGKDDKVKNIYNKLKNMNQTYKYHKKSYIYLYIYILFFFLRV